MFGQSTEQPFWSGPLICFVTRLLSLRLSDSSLAVGSGPDASTAPQKLLILDARSYTAAVANRAKGGGCECEGKQQSLSPCIQSSHEGHFSWVETCWCTAVPWVSSSHAAKTRHMTSKCSGFSIAGLILAQEEHVGLVGSEAVVSELICKTATFSFKSSRSHTSLHLFNQST